MAKAAVIAPAIIAVLLVCALILFTCKFCYNPRFLLRQSSDEESSYGSNPNGEKPPVGPVLSQEVLSVTSSSYVSSTVLSEPQAIAVIEAHPDDDDPDATVIAVAPNEPPIIEAHPPR